MNILKKLGDKMSELKSYDNNLDIYLNDIKDYEVLSKEEEKDLFIRYKKGDMKAKELLIKHNLRLVISCIGKSNLNSSTYLDLIQEGNMALIKAIESFDLSYDVRFSTYAYHKIISKVSKAKMTKSKLIKIPYHVCAAYYKLIKEKDLLEKRLNRNVTVEELASNLNISKEKIEELLYLPDASLSLDDFIIENETSFEKGLTFMEAKADDEDIIMNLEESSLRKELYNLICGLDYSKRDIEIILYRYGFIDGKMHTRREISEKYFISHQRIEQIEKRILKCMVSNKKIVDIFKAMDCTYYDDIERGNIYDVFGSYSTEEIEFALKQLKEYKRDIVKAWIDNKKLKEKQLEILYQACFEIKEYLRINSKAKVLKK